MEKWKTDIAESDEVDDLPPKVTEYMGECFYKIATHLSFRPNFINYTYREEMIGDGIENCIRYAKNFNPEKSKNPFAYFTQIIYYAFIRRITKEKKQQPLSRKLLIIQQQKLMMSWKVMTIFMQTPTWNSYEKISLRKNYLINLNENDPKKGLNIL